MIIAWIIGLVLSILGIWFLKDSRTNPIYGKKEPVLKMWALILFVIVAIIPIANIILGIIVIIWWAISLITEDWIYIKQDSKIIKFLNKPIK